MGESKSFEGWCILELMGHRRLGGHVTEVTIGGASFLRIDIPCDPPATQYYPPSSLYCLTPCGEAEARAVAASNAPRPVERWEMAEPVPQLTQAPPHDDYPHGIDDAEFDPVPEEETEDSAVPPPSTEDLERQWDCGL
jgi:hypothetical protein